ncbi:hypothetical protein [Geminisphaera colitermitum]|uniref:hypothetical protein n=1 Tax=Geminisphaera colitermitum TaxID=1148786 RepID=UPI000158D227|nr:hypothetical protein [Geminisphaera colitermitum]
MSQTETILLLVNGIILPLSCWTVYNVHRLVRDMAVESTYGKQHAIELEEIRTRLTAVEAEVIAIKLHMAAHPPKKL